MGLSGVMRGAHLPVIVVLFSLTGCIFGRYDIAEAPSPPFLCVTSSPITDSGGNSYLGR